MNYGEDTLCLLLVLLVMISNKESKPIFQNYLEMELQNDDNLPDSLISAGGGYGHAWGPPPPMEAPRGSERSEGWDSVGTGCWLRKARAGWML